MIMFLYSKYIHYTLVCQTYIFKKTIKEKNTLVCNKWGGPVNVKTWHQKSHAFRFKLVCQYSTVRSYYCEQEQNWNHQIDNNSARFVLCWDSICTLNAVTCHLMFFLFTTKCPLLHKANKSWHLTKENILYTQCAFY